MKGVLKIRGKAFVGLNTLEIFDGHRHIFTIPLKMIKRYGESFSSIFLELSNDIVIKTGKSDEVINFLRRIGIEKCNNFYNLGVFTLSNAVFSASLISILIFFIPELMPEFLNILMKFLTPPLIVFLGSLFSTFLFKILISSSKDLGIDNELLQATTKYSKVLKLSRVPKVHILNSINKGFIAMALPFLTSIIVIWIPKYCSNLCKHYIVAHELAHIFKKHMIKQILIYSFSAIILLMLAYVLININFNLFLIIFPILLMILISIIITVPYVQEADAHILATRLVGSRAFKEYINAELTHLLTMMEFIDTYARNKSTKRKHIDKICRELLSVIKPHSFFNRIKLWISSFPHPPRYMLLNLANTSNELNTYKLVKRIAISMLQNK